MAGRSQGGTGVGHRLGCRRPGARKERRATVEEEEQRALNQGLGEVRMRSSELPPESRRHRIATVEAFLEALWEARATQEVRGIEPDAGISPLWEMLERAAIARGRVRAKEGEIPCRDDSHLWARARRASPADGEWLARLEEVWGSLQPVDREVLTLRHLQGLTHQAIADQFNAQGRRNGYGQPITLRWVNTALSKAHHRITQHPVFEALQQAE